MPASGGSRLGGSGSARAGGRAGDARSAAAEAAERRAAAAARSAPPAPSPHPAASQPPPATPGGRGPTSEQWPCPLCTFLNAADNNDCEMGCGGQRPLAAPAAQSRAKPARARQEDVTPAPRATPLPRATPAAAPSTAGSAAAPISLSDDSDDEAASAPPPKRHRATATAPAATATAPPAATTHAGTSVSRFVLLVDERERQRNANRVLENVSRFDLLAIREQSLPGWLAPAAPGRLVEGPRQPLLRRR